MVQRGLLQTEGVDHGAVQDVVGLSEELVETPTLLLIRLQDVGQNRGQQALEAPGGRDQGQPDLQGAAPTSCYM